MNELSLDSIRAKQGGKARLLVRCLAGLLAINLLTLGIASWARMSSASVTGPEVAEHKQPSPAPPAAQATATATKTTIATRKVDVQPSPAVKINPPTEKISKAPVPIAIPPVASPVPPIVAPSAAPPATVPPGTGLEEALGSLNSALAQGQGALSEIPFTAARPAHAVPQSTPPSPGSPIESSRELPLQPGKPAREFLRLVNPRETGGEIHYEVDGASYSLLPGQFHQIPQGGEHEIEFHRGDNFGDVRLVLRKGVYVFAVGTIGWQLERTSKDLEASLSLAP
ncbi:MAG: hypothetical protein ACKVP0_05860 [Pirellulaceae bacterium]